MFPALRVPMGCWNLLRAWVVNHMLLLHHVSYLYAYLYIRFWQPLLSHTKMPKRKRSVYYSQLAKWQFTNHNTGVSMRVSVDTNLFMDATPDVSSGIESTFNYLFIHKCSVHFVENSSLVEFTNVSFMQCLAKNEPASSQIRSPAARRPDDVQNWWCHIGQGPPCNR